MTPSRTTSLWNELQRRHVYKVGAAYAVAGWLLVQVITQVFPIYDVSSHAQRIFVGVIIAGFPVALLLAWLFDVTPEGIVRTSAVATESQVPVVIEQRRGVDRKLNVVLGVLLLAGLTYEGVSRTIWKPPGTQKAGAIADKSIAVLPFENLSEDKANAYFATGIQDEILTRLSKIGALKVISRTSTAHFASSPDDLPEIAAKLGVSAILEGSVQRAGETVHVNVQLIRAASDEHLWAESYNRKLDDIFAVQGEIAQAVAEALSAKLTGDEKRQLTQKPTSNPQAYEAYLRGLSHEGHFTQTGPELKDWAEAYAEAVRLDPGFALAWAGLARANTEWYFDSDTTPQRLQLAKTALEQAQRLAPDAAETWEALGLFRYWGMNDYDGALAAYGEALKRNPSSSVALLAIGNVLRRQDRWEDALAPQERAAALDPLNGNIAFNLALTYRALRRFDEAQAALARGLTSNPDNPGLLGERIYTEQARGDLRAAHAFAEQLPLTGLDVFELSHRFSQWLAERDTSRAITEIHEVLERRAEFDAGGQSFLLALLGDAERLAGQKDSSRTHLLEARQIVEAQRAAGDLNAYALLGLGPTCAALGDHTAAEHYAQLAEDGLAHDALGLPQALVAHAIVRVIAGDKDGALKLLEQAQARPQVWGAFPAILRADPAFDSLRGDPRFERLSLDPAPHAAAKTS